MRAQRQYIPFTEADRRSARANLPAWARAHAGQWVKTALTEGRVIGWRTGFVLLGETVSIKTGSSLASTYTRSYFEGLSGGVSGFVVPGNPNDEVIRRELTSLQEIEPGERTLQNPEGWRRFSAAEIDELRTDPERWVVRWAGRRVRIHVLRDEPLEVCGAAWLGDKVIGIGHRARSGRTLEEAIRTSGLPPSAARHLVLDRGKYTWFKPGDLLEVDLPDSAVHAKPAAKREIPPFPHSCPACGAPALILAMSVDCSATGCSHKWRK